MDAKKTLCSIASALAVSTSCAQTPDPVCYYDQQVEETASQRSDRLGKYDGACLEVVDGHNDIRRKRINIVFVGVNYNRDDFIMDMRGRLDCSRVSNGLLSVEPFTSNIDNMNFWYVPSIPQVDDYVSGKEEDASEAELPALAAAEQCDLPNRAIIVLPNWRFNSNADYSSLFYLHMQDLELSRLPEYQEKLKGMTMAQCMAAAYGCGDGGQESLVCEAIDAVRGRQERSLDVNICNILSSGSVMFGTAMLSPADTKYVAGHELSHSIIGLRDEYVDPSHAPDMTPEQYLESLKEFPINCFPAASEEECLANAPWKGLLGDGETGCFQGCGYFDGIAGVPLWRPTYEDVMNHSRGPYMGPWEEKLACIGIEIITNNATGVCPQYLPLKR